MTFFDDAIGNNRWKIDDDSNTLHKILDYITNNKVAAGAISASVIATAVALYIYKVKSSTVLSIENVSLKKENGEVRESITQLNSKITTMEVQIGALECSLSKVDMMCVICAVNTLARTIVPCGHSICEECALKIKKCPFCNQAFEKIIARY